MALTRTIHVQYRLLCKEPVKYPVIAKQKEYIIYQIGMSVNVPAGESGHMDSEKLYLPDRGTIMAVLYIIDHAGESGNELYSIMREWLKMNDLNIGGLEGSSRLDSTVGQKCKQAWTRFDSGLFIPVNDDDVLHTQISADNSDGSGIQYCGANCFIYMIKED